MAEKISKDPKSPDELRRILLQYFYDRNQNATSTMGKKGSAVKISDIKSELKASHSLTQQQVQSNLTYLISQGWVDTRSIQKEFQSPRGTTIPSVSTFYQISAAGIDKIEGPGEFTMPKFHDIKIEATGQNIITVGDGNQVDARFEGLGESLSDLRKAITESDADEKDKLSYVADIDTIQSQLAKANPNPTIIGAAWESVKAADSIYGCAGLLISIAPHIAALLGQ